MHEGHVHIHEGGHTHSSAAEVSNAAQSKELALLKYMLEHNKQHAGELAQMGDTLSGAGFSEASGLIADAVHYFEHANEKLEKAVGLMVDN